MRFDIHVHLPLDNSGILGEIRSDLKRLLQMGTKQMADLTRLTQEVSEVGTAVDSAVLLLGQLADLIRQNQTDPAALEALANELDAKGTALADAVVQNTPSA